MSEWQDISTAPKWPERFVGLGYDKKHGWWSDHRAMRHHKTLADKDGNESHFLVDGWFSRCRQPSLWMPFPAKPNP